MPLAPGVRLGPYEIQSPLGAGGMGEVYRAKDTRLDRTVAIKVLPAGVAADQDRRQRLDREARAVAALNHPHICALYDVGHQDGIDFLVMEYLDGETLADRLLKGALPLDRALTIAIEIADALGKAHRAGIIHRDLKPGNVMLTKTGAKLLDFGLAKVGSEVMALGVTTAPTRQPLTADGAILGTLQYMAPEQLEGKEADSRTDLFAFGAVLYEMVTGRRASEAKSQASLIAAILQENPPPVTTLQPIAPALLDRLVQRCLAKDPDTRWQSVQDVASVLRWIAESVPLTGASGAIRKSAWARPGWGLAGLVFVGLAFAMTALYTTKEPKDQRLVRLSLNLPDKVTIGSEVEIPVVSPDGRRVAFAALSGGSTLLWVRALDSSEAGPLAGTEGAAFPFWSPDSQSVGFFAEGKLKRIPVGGGAPQVLCAAAKGLGGDWNRDGVILFVPDDASGLARVSAAGGTPTSVTTVNPSRSGESYHLYPRFLPDGRHFLYLAIGGHVEESRVYLGTLGSPEQTPILQAPTSAAYAPSGHLLFVRDRHLLAQPFDVDNLRLHGDAVVVADAVHRNAGWGTAAFSVSADGVVTYRAPEPFPQRQLTWFDREGKALSPVGPPAEWYVSPRLSPNGQRIAMARTGEPPAGPDIWLIDVPRGIPTRFTSDPGWDLNPAWAPDGARLAFASDRAGPKNLYVRDARGAAREELLLASAVQKDVTDWSPDGRFIVYHARGPEKLEVWALPLFGDRKPFGLAQTAFNNGDGVVSPGGRWLAYSSDESGPWEVYVQAFPVAKGKTRISTTGGGFPRWRGDGRELFYRGDDNVIMSVAVDGLGESFETDPPKALPFRLDPDSSYDVAPDGQRFLVAVPLVPSSPAAMTVVLNWTAALKK